MTWKGDHGFMNPFDLGWARLLPELLGATVEVDLIEVDSAGAHGPRMVISHFLWV